MFRRKDVLSEWERIFSARGLDSPRLSAQVLLAHILRLDRLALLLDLNVPVQESDLTKFQVLAKRREAGEPVAYLTGHKEFYGLDLLVTPDVLIPRPETELLIDFVRNYCVSRQNCSILDIGTGSGAVAIACASCLPSARVVGVDISNAALKIAKINAMRHGLQGKIDFVLGDLVQPLQLSSFRVLLANLPYVPLKSYRNLSPEVRNFEPHLALFAGMDGLDCYNRLAAMINVGVDSGTELFCEIDPSQKNAVQKLFGLKARQIDVLKDFSGLERFVHVVF
ncbi:MAG: peptide chain release factor N(5)-glutamine methyltransferase [Bacteroidales bacterium]|nr:peptide chain release factor N(5)-glutamine methyltransferase [Bacteroidales bacterium]NCD35280.1 peptide chain release factor N(5)-glutamine methyltransferase [Spartobacteria bacterium]